MYVTLADTTGGAGVPGSPPTDDAGALEWIRAQWSKFVGLSPRILDLQHRAALASQAYREQGNQRLADTARRIIEELAKLQQIHHRVVTWGEQAAGALGVGVVQIPAGILGVAFAALLMAWVFRKYETQEEAMRLLESGVLTPEEFERLDILDPPGIGSEIGGIAGGIGKWVLLGILAWVVLEAVRGGGFRRNPPVFLFGNPPMSDDVQFIAYRHSEDGAYYIHEFGGGVEMEAQEDGSLLVYHPEHEVWRDF